MGYKERRGEEGRAWREHVSWLGKQPRQASEREAKASHCQDVEEGRERYWREEREGKRSD